MKRTLKLFLLIVVVLLISGCSSNPIKEISYNDLEKKLKNGESFILEIVQDGCSNCENFSPKFSKVLKQYDLEAVAINLTNITQEENTKLNNLYNVSGTPAVIFIENGEEPSISRRIVGDVSKDKIVSKLKIAGYIKK